MKIYVKPVYVTCPCCGEDIEGEFFGDPRGKEVECDQCEQAFMVPEDAELVFV